MEFAQKKKQKVEHRPGRPRPHREPSHAEEKKTDARADEKSLLSQLSLSQISDTVSSFFALLNPFRNAVSSLVKSTKKIEKLLQDKDDVRSRQITTYFSHEAFAREHKAEGLIMSSSQGIFFGICMLCTKHTNAIGSVSSFDSDWVVHGRRLDEHKKRTWERHLQSQMHKQAQDLESQPDISGFFSAGAQKAKMLTQNFLRLTYSAIMMFLPYRQLIRLFTTLHLCDFEVGNRNMSHHAAAAACDTFYDYIFANVSKHFCSHSPSTNRARCFGITADKGTEVNQRQVINIHSFDVDGKLVSIQLAAHIINEIDVSENCAEESTAKALLAHIMNWLKKLGLSEEEIFNAWTTVCTDKEACYLLMGKLQLQLNAGFVGISDASHGIESLFDDVEKDLPWFGRVLAIIDRVHSRYSGSPKKKRKLRRTADIFDMMYVSLKRIVETRYIKFSVVAGDALLKMFKSLILVLEDDISSTKDDGAIGLLSSLVTVTTVPELLTVLDVLDHAVSFSCASQSGKFSIFDYLERRRSFINKIQIMSQTSFNVNIKVPGSTAYLSQRLHDNQVSIKNKEFKGFQLGQHNLVPRLRSGAKLSGHTLFKNCLIQQQKLCNVILQHIDRLPEESFYVSIERVIHPRLVLKEPYNLTRFSVDLESVCTRLDLMDLHASIVVGHKNYANILATHENDVAYTPLWKTKGTWNPLGVIESFMNPSLPLHKGMEDFCVLLERVGLLRFTQADTERVVKTIRKVEKRFSNFNEVKEAAGKRDRALQEIFIHENHIALNELPLESLHNVWVQRHWTSLKKRSAAKAMSIDTFLRKDASKARFLTN